MKRFGNMVLLCLTIVALLIVACLWHVGDKTGARASGTRLDRIKSSKSWRADKKRFENVLRRVDGSFVEMGARYFFGGSKYREPSTSIEPKILTTESFSQRPSSELRVSWFGHSSFLVELEGLNVLVDPVWGQRASPFSFAGPKRFYQPPIALNDLPKIDVVLISHDHYDHLDYHTVIKLKDQPMKWFVPLGVGAHLEHWGVSSNLITEFDWWDEIAVDGVKFVSAPARHFSGRSIFFTDQNKTLWSGWAIVGVKRRLFYSGDTALHPDFAEIGERLGPFDITLMETGAYNQLWCDVHLGPEQAVLAHQMVRGHIMIPVHWGLFDLALHSWTEPAERVVEAARTMDVPITIIPPGGQYEFGSAPKINRWWPDVPWEQVAKAPAWSTSVKSLQEAFLKDTKHP